MKKGYTLIELIILLVTLTVLAVIFMPVVLKKIDSSRKDNARSAAYEIINEVKLYYSNTLNENDTFEQTTFNCVKNCSSNDYELEINSSNKPNDGFISIANDGTITGKLVYYSGDYTFYICNTEVFDEEVSSCTTSNQLYLTSSDYTAGEEILYAGTKWNVISDNGDNTTLILKGTIGTSVMNEETYNYQESSVKEFLDKWFENNSTLVLAKNQNKLVSMKFTDGTNEYEDYIRIPTKSEVSFSKVLDKCKSVWCDIKESYWLITPEKNGKVWSIGDDGEAYNVLVTSQAGVRPVITVVEQ